MGGTLVAAVAEPTGFNRMTSKNVGSATANVVENIFFYASKATHESKLVYPGLEAAPVLLPPTTEHPQIVEWRIHKDARWSDGTPVTSEDLSYFYDEVRSTRPKHDVVSREGYENIDKLELVNAKTLKAYFKTIYPDFRTLFNDVPNAAFMKEAQARNRDNPEYDAWNTALDKNPGPSAGPFVFKEWVPGQSITLDRNPQWWGPGRPLDSIVLRFYRDATAQVDALRNGEVDLIAPAAQRDLIEQAGRLEGVVVDVGFGPQWEQITFNTRNPILADVAMRRLIARAIDRKAIVDTLIKPFAKDAVPLGNFIYMTNQRPEYVPHDQAYQVVDPAGVGRLLEAAGWALNGDVREKDGRKLSLRLSTTSANPVREQAQELIVRQLAAVGIEAVVDNCAGTCLTNQRAPAGNFDLALFSWRGSVYPVGDIGVIYGTGAEANFGKFSNATFDDKVKAASSTVDPAAQVRLANELDILLWAELPALPLFQRPTFLAVRNQFDGITNNPTTDGIFWNSHEFAVKPGRG